LSASEKYEKAFNVKIQDQVSQSNGIDGQSAARPARPTRLARRRTVRSAPSAAARPAATASHLVRHLPRVDAGVDPLPEPKHAVVKNGVTFNVMDLKALPR